MKLLKVFLFLILLTTLLTSTAYASLPYIGQPWYENKMEFPQSVLPEGVTVDDVPYYGENKYGLINRSSVPIYIIQKDNEGKSFENSEVPAGYRPLFKLISGKEYCYYSGGYDIYPGVNADRVCLGQGNIYGWNEESIYVYRDAIINILNLKLPTTYFGGYRPQDAKVPDPVNFNLLVYYKGEVREIPGQIVYSLNKNFKPDSPDPNSLQYVSYRASYLVSDAITMLLYLVFMISGALMAIGLSGEILDRILSSPESQAIAASIRPRNIMMIIFITISALYVYADYLIIKNYEYKIDWYYAGNKYIIAIYFVLFFLIAILQIFTLWKLNKFIFKWHKGIKNKTDASKVKWSKLLFKGLIGFIVIYFFYFFVSIIAGLFGMIKY